MTDTSTQAVEAMAKLLEKCVVDYGCEEDEPWNAAQLLRTLAAERESRAEIMRQILARENAAERHAAFEEAAKVCDAFTNKWAEAADRAKAELSVAVCESAASAGVELAKAIRALADKEET